VQQGNCLSLSKLTSHYLFGRQWRWLTYVNTTFCGFMGAHGVESQCKTLLNSTSQKIYLHSTVTKNTMEFYEWVTSIMQTNNGWRMSVYKISRVSLIDSQRGQCICLQVIVDHVCFFKARVCVTTFRIHYAQPLINRR